jgi:hypothetical protein
MESALRLTPSRGLLGVTGVKGSGRQFSVSVVLASLAGIWGQQAVAQPHPTVVQRELHRLIEDCRTAGGRPDVKAAAVTRASLRDGSFSDFVIWSGEIDCHGAPMAFGGAAGQALALVPGDGRGVRQVPAHSWRLVGDGPMVVEIVGGLDCAAGHQNRCTQRLAWTGAAFEPTSGNAIVLPVNAYRQPRSIVGDWSESVEGCASPTAGLVRIGAMSLSNDEFVCRFGSVARSGATVTWTGICEEGLGTQAGRKRKATVTATEANGRLMVRVNGNAWTPMIRCPDRQN